MSFLIGQCCVDQIITPDPGSNDISGKNEIVRFENQSFLTIQWDSTRKVRFGDAGVLYVEIKGTDGKYRKVSVEIIPNDPVNTAFYSIDLGGLSTGRVIIT